MPRLLIYEECLAAGTEGPLGDETQNFLPEGLAMTLAVAEDFAKLPGYEVRVMRSPQNAPRTSKDVNWRWVDSLFGAEACLQREAKLADLSLVIAPECCGLLQQRAQAVLAAGGALLGPTPDWIEIAADKSTLLERLAAAGIPTPRGVRDTRRGLVEIEWRYPVVLKPNDGAGATNTLLIQNREQLFARLALADDFEIFDPLVINWRCEEFIPGKAASVAVMCGPAGVVALRPAVQRIEFAAGGCASYRGGAINLSPAEEARARKLGIAVAQALPTTNGYIGIDLILGPASDGSADAVIEVNPRLTTSYLGLRHATQQSLADAMWRIAKGEMVNIAWLPNQVEFTKQGQVTIRDRSRS
jgi:predicted ATP-grasp superfamily ATP-dependent carboligase